MELLISHWHCIIPVIALLIALFLMREKDEVSAEKKNKISDPHKNHKSS